jgi:superfamily II DNA/RNA helicase
LKTQALHGDKSQDERLKALQAFKAGEVDLLVATDVAARGLDIADLPAVFNFDVPFHAEDYVHRIGRTGRAGASGLAVTLVARDDMRLVGDIEKLLKRKIELEPIEIDDDRPRRPARPRADAEREPAVSREHDAAREQVDRVLERAGERAVERSRRPAPAPHRAADPFFDQPYEPRADTAPAAWEKGAASAAAVKLPTSNIRPKKKVAALLGGSR